ncbi:IS110 family transposase [Spongiactinospora gelatinilytica]|uniref:IS110 family transposase n=1 Tax=Spongiactinospora gelatinilytica TaxID=2666298 RepID=A0A2W2E6K3_9ACTN|nr:IS110 family transposase [Spongiactinospora gelatinilytica]PZG18183.1 IS110 family transposase [Spongiactinospora gelatinilytica]
MTEFKKPKARRIVGGVDTHADTHHAAVVLMNGRRVADREFSATRAGYADLLEWMRSFGRLQAVGVEGTGSYGAALARHLSDAEVKVVEVNRPDRQQRRAKGKSDPLDSYSAAEAVLADRARAVPKSGNGLAESIRVLHLIRAGAVKARTACLNELQALLVTAPAELREQLGGLKKARLADACSRLRPSADLADPAQSVKVALRHLAGRYRALSAEIDATYDQLKTLVEQARPELPAIKGVGVETAAQLPVTCGDNPERLSSEGSFAALCGVSPVPASSGRTRRHRLNHGGDRQANRALYVVVLSRMSCGPPTRAYVERGTAEGLSKREIIRCLKRYVARQLYKVIVRPQAPAAESPVLS